MGLVPLVFSSLAVLFIGGGVDLAKYVVKNLTKSQDQGSTVKKANETFQQQKGPSGSSSSSSSQGGVVNSPTLKTTVTTTHAKLASSRDAQDPISSNYMDSYLETLKVEGTPKQNKGSIDVIIASLKDQDNKQVSFTGYVIEGFIQ